MDNTNTKKSRNYVFTINNYTEADQDAVDKLACRYLIVGEEVGESGTPHLQGAVCFKNARSMKSVSKDLPRAHLEVMRGNWKENIAYCSKQGKFTERGSRPMSQAEKGDLNKERYERAWALAKEGKIEEIDADIRIRHLSTLKKIALDFGVPPKPNDTLENRWIWGPTGSGKSREAAMTYPGAYYKMCNKWWDGYKGEETVIIDDLDKRHVHLAHHLKIWADHNPFIAEWKGGASTIRHKRIIITSNYPPEGIWEAEPETLEPLQRRYKIEYKA